MEQSRTGSGSAVYETGNEHPLPLQITDFAEQDEKKDSIDLWDTQVEELKRTLGI